MLVKVAVRGERSIKIIVDVFTTTRAKSLNGEYSQSDCHSPQSEQDVWELEHQDTTQQQILKVDDLVVRFKC